MMVHTERALGCVYEAVPCLPVRYHQIVEMGIVNALTSQHFIAKWQERLPHSACPEANWMRTIPGQQRDYMGLFVYGLKGPRDFFGKRVPLLGRPRLAPSKERTKAAVTSA